MNNSDHTEASPATSAVKPQDDRHAIAPAVDIYENANEYLLHVDLPGVTEDAIDIQFDKGDLSLFAERTENDKRDETDASGELAAAVYRRSFRVPEQIDTANVKAKYKSGVLEVHLPKSPDVRPRRIAVQVN